MHGSPAVRGCANGGGVLTRECATGINDYQEALTDLGQLADGVITRGCYSKGFGNNEGDTGNKGCDIKGCANM